MRRWMTALLLLLVVAGCRSAGPSPSAAPPTALRLGYMANLTHAQALLGLADGSLERAAGAPIRPKLFSAGPPAIQALFAGEIDLLYVGPSPAINGYLRSEGKAVRVIAGAASGGALFVVRPGVDPDRLDRARLATPGLANTQDVSLRHLLAQRGLTSQERGGSVRVTPMAPSEILSLFSRGQIDGAWVAEPWGSRLIQEGGGILAYDERDLWPDGTFATTLLVVSPDYLARHREVVKGFLEGHLALTQWIQTHPDEARARLQAALAKLQGRPLPDQLVAAAFARIDFRSDPMVASVEEQAQRAHRLGYLGNRRPDLFGLYDLSLLQEVAP